MRSRTVLVAVALAVVAAAPAHALTNTAMGPWACAGVEPVAGVCVNNPWVLLP